jgi:hypothetical protein
VIAVRCLTTADEATPYRDAMTALNLAVAKPDPFSSPDFLERHRSQLALSGLPFQLWLLLVFRHDTLVGYAALKRCVTRVLGLRAAKLDWLTDHAAPCPHVVTHDDDSEIVCAALSRYLLQQADQWSLLELQQQPENSPFAVALTRQLGDQHRLRGWPNLTHWSVPIAGHGLASYHAALSPQFRSNVSRQVRRLFASGTVSLMEGSDPAALPELMTQYRRIMPTSWKARSRHIDAGPSGAPADLPVAASAMPVTVQLLLLDGIPVAGLICGDHAGATYALDMAYDQRHAEVAPGVAMLLFGLQRAMQIGSRRFDLLRGFGYYKHRWLGLPTATESVQIYRRGGPWDWHRVLGDILRRPQDSSESLDHNPMRREAVRAGQAIFTEPGFEGSAQQLVRAQLSVLAARSGVRVRGGAELAVTLPFPLGPQKARPSGAARNRPLAVSCTDIRSSD